MLDTYKGKRVLVTGHTGFKGGWLSLWLKELGAEVYGVGLRPEKRSLFYALSHGVSETFVDGSLFCDILEAEVSSSDPDIAFHLAAQPLVRRSYVDPVETYTTNIMGTVSVLESFRKNHPNTPVLVITSDKCYSPLDTSHPETDQLGGVDPYSASKACVELIVSSYRKGFGMNVTTARAGNVIGGGDWNEDRLIPDLLKGKPVRNPRAVRAWIYVLDVLYGYLLMGEKLLQGEWVPPLNFGPHTPMTVQVVAERFCHDMGLPRPVHAETTGPEEAPYLHIDSRLAKFYVGWDWFHHLSSAVRYTALWYKAHNEGRDMAEFSRNDIKLYMMAREAEAECA